MTDEDMADELSSKFINIHTNDDDDDDGDDEHNTNNNASNNDN